MSIAYTICTINYLAQAKVLGTSILKSNPTYKFIICLIDKKERIPLSFDLTDFDFIELEALHVREIDDMLANYNFFELSCSLKPFFAEYIFENYDANNVFYFDSDIYVYNSLVEAEEILQNNNMLLTLHSFTPLPDDNCSFKDQNFLNTGLYNGGFFGLSRKCFEDKKSFLYWWKDKLKYNCKVDFIRGEFVDQLWLNFSTIYFDKILIFRNCGYNVAFWNLHERKITQHQQEYIVLGPGEMVKKLVFFHFTGYDINQKDMISKYDDRWDLDLRADLKLIFTNYGLEWESTMSDFGSALPNFYEELIDSRRRSLVTQVNQVIEYQVKKEKMSLRLKRFVKKFINYN